jgi:hypothetical protein
VNTTGWLKGLQVTADGTGIVSHAGVALLRGLSDNIGLTVGLSKALASRRLLVHDRGRVLADLACAIAGGAEVISNFPGDRRPGGVVRAGRLGAHGVAHAGGDRPRRGAGAGQADRRGERRAARGLGGG